MSLRGLIRGLGVGGRKKRKQKQNGGNQTANFPKPNIILILADDVGGILVMLHLMWFVDYLDCIQKEERKLHKQNLDCKP